jgi:Flp pilus assembly protein TadG
MKWKSKLKFLRDEAGQTLAITVLGMTVLMGMMGIAIDVGLLFRAKRIAQTAADAAAVAGAINYDYNGSSTSATTVARAAAQTNGIPNPATNVAVNFSPNITSPFHNSSGYLQAVVNLPNPTFFISHFYGTGTSMTVTARAIAGITPSVACVYVLDPSSASALYIQGAADISTPNCGIQVNSNSPDAFCDQGSATIEANFLHIVGGQSSHGKCAKAPGTTPVTTGVTPVGDPFNNMTGPIPPTPCTGAGTVPATTTTITSSTTIPSTPVTTGSTTASVTYFCATNPTIANGVTLGTPGGNQIFVFVNGVTIGGTVTVNGTIDIYQGTFTQGNSALTVNAPANTTYTYNGIAVMEPSSNTSSATCKDGLGLPCLQLQFGSGSGVLNGLVYAPTSQVYQQDNGGGTVVAGVIAYQIYLKASSMDITNSYNAANPTTTPLTKVSLVE